MPSFAAASKLRRATSGSASFLNDSLASLVRELQPVRQAVTTAMNSLGILAVNTARLVNILFQLHPAVKATVMAAEKLEKTMAKRKQEEAQAGTKDFMRAIRDGSFKMPKAKKPGEK
jgi:hypothetical protein